MADQETDVLAQLTDELKLQAWLANAELRHPSLKHDTAREEISVLAQMRDELRVQMHLGQLEAKDEFDRLEKKWGVLKQFATVAEDVGEALDSLVHDIKEGYDAMRDGV